MNIVIPDKIDIDEEHIKLMSELGADIFDDIPDIDNLKKRIANAQIITANYIDITAEIIDSAPRLKYIIVPAVGYEWVDVNYAASKGIVTLNCPTFNSRAVAEHAISLMMTANRKILPAAVSLRSGNWRYWEFMGLEVNMKSLGLVGHGNIGKIIHKMAEGIGMKVSFINSKSSSNDIDNMLAQSDFVIICAQLNDKTRGLIDRRRLELLKEDVILVNVGRGAIIDQNSLFNRLKENKLRGAALDVFDNEPVSGTPPEDLAEIAQLPNVVAVPPHRI